MSNEVALSPCFATLGVWYFVDEVTLRSTGAHTTTEVIAVLARCGVLRDAEGGALSDVALTGIDDLASTVLGLHEGDWAPGLVNWVDGRSASGDWRIKMDPHNLQPGAVLLGDIRVRRVDEFAIRSFGAVLFLMVLAA